MKDTGSSSFERWLRSVTLKPAPPGLRDKVLKAAARRREEAAWTTPLLRRGLAACASIVLVVSVADGLVSGAQRSHLMALGGGPRPSIVRSDDETKVLAEVLGEAAAGKLAAMEMAAGSWRSVRKPAGDELRELELIMEGGDESQKDLQ